MRPEWQLVETVPVLRAPPCLLCRDERRYARIRRVCVAACRVGIGLFASGVALLALGMALDKHEHRALRDALGDGSMLAGCVGTGLLGFGLLGWRLASAWFGASPGRAAPAALASPSPSYRSAALVFVFPRHAPSLGP